MPTVTAFFIPLRENQLPTGVGYIFSYNKSGKWNRYSNPNSSHFFVAAYPRNR